MRTRPTSPDRTAFDSASVSAFGDPARTGTATPTTAVLDAVATLLGLFVFVAVAGALAPFAPPFGAFVALWLVGLPAAFATAAVAVRAAVRVRRTARRLACAHWNLGCEHDAEAAV